MEDLKSQIKILQEQLKIVQDNNESPINASTRVNTYSERVQYGTDEEELANKTG